MSKILAIVASPRRDGNCETIVNAITDGSMGLSPNVLDIINLNALRFTNGCQACMSCKSTGSCATKDDLSPILDLIKGADSLIVATPVYFGHSSSQYRMLEDRLYCFIGKNGLSTIPKGKKLVTVVTCSGKSSVAKAVAEDIENMYVNCFSFDPVGSIVLSDGGSKHAAEDDDELLERARLLGKKL
ncbi:MAG: flavodoxin family protein [Methanomassiliicoccaceae archaeon]|nr:flavodoxin family protein [Methanomassiliicoccaceae archaeon]